MLLTSRACVVTVAKPTRNVFVRDKVILVGVHSICVGTNVKIL